RKFANPGSSALREYWPGVRAANSKAPASFDVVVATALSRIPLGVVSRVDTVSGTPGTAAPLLSYTVPAKLPSARPCARAGLPGTGFGDFMLADMATKLVPAGAAGGAGNAGRRGSRARSAATGKVTAIISATIKSKVARLSDR